MSDSDRISPRQFVAAAFLSALSPLIRRFPRTPAALAGRGAWFAVLLSAVPMLAAAAAAALLLRRQRGRGLAEVFTALLGKLPGRALTGLYGLWFIFYAGFLLRSGAERFLTTVYSGAQPALFVLVMALLCAVGAAGRLRPLGRCAMLLRPLMLALLLGIALLTLKDIDLALLLPLPAGDLRAQSAAALETANVLSVVFFLGFLGGRLERPLRPRDWAPWLAALLGIIALMTVQCLGVFGAELTAALRYPYFMLVRDVSVLGALERLEPAVIALWVFPDFLLIALLLRLAAENFRFAFGAAGCGRLPLLCAAAAAAAAMAIPGALADFRTLSERTVPLLCALFGFAPLPPLLLLAALRKER